MRIGERVRCWRMGSTRGSSSRRNSSVRPDVPWTDEQLDKLRDRLSLAKRQGAWLSGTEVWVVLDLIRFWRRSTKLTGMDGVAQGALPTIADSKAHGIGGAHIQCGRIGCGNRRRMSWEEIGLPEATVFVEIGRARRFRCHRCSSRDVIVSADWPRPKMGAGS